MDENGSGVDERVLEAFRGAPKREDLQCLENHNAPQHIIDRSSALVVTLTL
jgi:hypothetical protein